MYDTPYTYPVGTISCRIGGAIHRRWIGGLVHKKDLYSTGNFVHRKIPGNFILKKKDP